MMSSQNQRASLSSFPDIPLKRKRRGRPKSMSVMLGQMVSGVIEGSFDAGYLLNVKVGDTNTHLRGVVFRPGLFAPVTDANDVAPHAKMYERKDMHIPFVYLQGHPHVLSPSGTTEKPVERKHEASKPEKPGASVASEPMSANFAATLPVTEAINPKPHDYDAMSLDVGNRKTPEISELEPQAIACDTGSNLFSEQALSRQDTQLELAQKIMNERANMTHMDGLSASGDVITTGTAPFSASMSSLPVMTFGAETIPFEAKYAAEESVLPPMVIPEGNSSLMTANTYGVESNAKDAFRSPRS